MADTFKKVVLYNRTRLLIIGFIGLTFSACTIFSQKPNTYDTVIVNGKVMDGTGNPWYYADIAINDDEIVKVGHIDKSANDTIDAKGLYVTPGFIDVHTHAASGLTDPDLSSAEPQLRQGITTVFINPDGGGAVDMKNQREALMEDGVGVNVAQLSPHGSIREKVMGMEDRAPTSEELDKMRQLVRDGMLNGAFGLSSGPFYSPGSYASTDELVELAKVASEFGGAYTSHIRDESNYTIGLEASVDEVIQVAEEANLPGVVTHIKALGPPVWEMSETIVENIEKSRSKGIEVYADQYPYEASATGLISALVPRWAEEGGYDSLRVRLEDQEQLERIRSAMEENLERRGGPDRIQFRYYNPDSSIEGKTLKDVADNRDEDALSTAIDLIKEGGPGIVSFNMTEEDVHRFMRQPWTMTSSDGGLVHMGEGVPHPRNYGTFPRKIRKYVLADKIIELTHAVRSMTTLPAQVFDLWDRGQIRKGAKADIAIFDPQKLKDNATFQDPHQLSEGIEYVLVNGNIALDRDNLSSERSGRVLHHSDKE
ncbi:N-acyl-D-amino-acid deacylase family protein [Fodinibius sp. SL11]|uniref:N-acyl-D-amino-acid deacylase family protein n=1 Tax=Fodinibius sp. SL11 TaxID=3425690 RepID=UPI003F88366E